ncbi:MAG: YhjD/YihY/BrkB family envelope integrity protein [Candidatus Campbellbacteria bacterium]|nr:YhjD/YihY/BrkB family envelope integrity protein [Candidatus Campbellbacteria bacterium]
MRLLVSVKNIVTKAAKVFLQFRIAERSAALAYFALFALAPILILITSLASIFVFGSFAQSGIEEFFLRYFGSGASVFFEQVIERADNLTVDIAVAVAGFLLVVFAATGFFRALQRSLFEVFSVSIEGNSTTKNILYNNLYSSTYMIIFLFFIIGLFVARLVLTTGIELAENFFDYNVSGATIRALSAILVLVLLSLFLGGSYRFFSRRSVTWLDSFIGGFAASVLILLLNNLLGLYFAFSEALLLYGAASFLVAILLWLYLFSMIILIGALISRYVSRL